MSYTSPFRILLILHIAFYLCNATAFSQGLSEFKIESEKDDRSIIANKSQFNGYTNHWQNSYSEWFRYGNLFKIAQTDIESTILQSKVNTAEDLGLTGLLMQEGFIYRLLTNHYTTIEDPSSDELEIALKKGNTLVLTNPATGIGQVLEDSAMDLFNWSNEINSYQFNAVGLERIKAFYLVNDTTHLFVISSSSGEQVNRLLLLINGLRDVLSTCDLYKGLFGVRSFLKSVTCEPGHPIELIGVGMNEGNSWFVFDGSMDFLAKEELENWVKASTLPIVVDVGASPIYGCSNYDDLQIQDMSTKQSWIDYAHKRGGYAFRPVYSPESDEFDYDGYIVYKGNKDQIDNENVPFINRTGFLSGNLISSMMLFIEKGDSLSQKVIWDAIMSRRSVAILENAEMMGASKYRNALQLLYLDKEYLEDYFSDRLDLKAEVIDYNLVVTIKNYNSKSVTGKLQITTPPGIRLDDLLEHLVLKGGEEQVLNIPLQVDKRAMGMTNPIAVTYSFSSEKKHKSTLTFLDLPPTISVHRLLYAHATDVVFPVTIHNFSDKNKFPVEVTVFKKNAPQKEILKRQKNYQVETSSFKEEEFLGTLNPGDYIVRTNALGVVVESQLGVGKAEGKAYAYEIDLDSDGINEYRMENDSVQITLLRTGARVIEYIIKSKNDNILFKIWPQKAVDHKKAFRLRNFYPYGGFEDFLGQASMETHHIYEAKLIRKEGDYVQVEMEADYYGNHLKKIFTLYGNSPLLEIRFELLFKNREANVIGPQPILELGESHGTEDLFIVPTIKGHKEYRMKPEAYYGQAIHLKEGWNAGYDTKEDITFIGAFPVWQPIFLHMWMNLPNNTDAPHSYVEFQPWTPIVQNTKTYFSYYIWGCGGQWGNGFDELKKRNLITVK